MTEQSFPQWPDKFAAYNGLSAEKVEQAIGLLDELDLDAWLTFAQKMGDAGGDPVYPIIFGERDLGAGMLLLTRGGERIALVGGLDTAIPRGTGVWDQVIDHQGDMGRALVEVLTRLSPRQLAINYAQHNTKADGLSHGRYLWLCEALAGTSFAKRLGERRRPDLQAARAQVARRGGAAARRNARTARSRGSQRFLRRAHRRRLHLSGKPDAREHRDRTCRLRRPWRRQARETGQPRSA